MKLYYMPGACSLAPHILLREAGLAHSLAQVDRSKKVVGTGADFFAVNPKGSVPTLELDDGQVLTEGPVIAQYICDQGGNPELMPAAGTMARYRVMEWQNFITSELHKSFAPLFNPATDDAGKAMFMAMLRKKFEWVSTQLDGKDFLTGANFTAADAYLFTVAAWSAYVKLDLSDLAPLQAFLARVKARPHVVAAMTAEGLIR